MRRLLALVFVLFPGTAWAVHPRAVWDSTILTRIRAKAAGSTADWLALKGSSSGPVNSCDYLTRTTAGTPDSLPPVYPPWEPVTSNPPGTITHGYQGSEFYIDLVNLATCYEAVLLSDPPTAAKYAAQAIKILQKSSTPFPSVAPASPPTSRGTVTSRMAGAVSTAGAVSNAGPGGQARVNLYYHGLTTGATVTISGVTGCTAANITGKVGATTQLYLDLNDSGGSPVICNGAGTNYNWMMLTDAGSGMRFFGVLLALGYDWFEGVLSAGDKTNIFNTLNAFLDEDKRYSYLTGQGGVAYDGATQNNYHSGYFAAVALAGICTRGAGENSRGQEWYDYWHTTLWEGIDKPFYSRWLGNNGGFDGAIQYQLLSVSSLALTAFAQYTANAENLLGSPLGITTSFRVDRP